MSLEGIVTRKLSCHLLALAERDRWKTTLYILLHYPTKINLNARTKNGDYLIHLASFASCEQSQQLWPLSSKNSSSFDHLESMLETQKYALTCLSIILERDFTAANKVAGDGGTALHCALAAASTFDDYDINNEADYVDIGCDKMEHHDSNGEESDDDNDDDDDDDDDDMSHQIDNDLMNQLTSKADQAITLAKHCSDYLSLSSQEIILVTIQLLLKYDADPNTPLINLYDQQDGEDPEELAYSTVAVVQQWAPLMFALEWSVRAANVHRHKHNTSAEQQPMQFLTLPIIVIILLLHYGADPTYMTAESFNNRRWNALHFIISSTHVICNVYLDDELLLEMNRLSQHTSLEPFQDKYATQIDLCQLLFDTFMENMRLSGEATNITPIQSFTAAVLSNNAERAQSILDDVLDHSHVTSDKASAESQILKEWLFVNMYDIIPFSKLIWGKLKSSQSITLLDMASSCMALDSIRLLIGNNYESIPQAKIRNAIKCLFEYSNSPFQINTGNAQNLNARQKLVLSLLLDIALDSKDTTAVPKPDTERQMILDTALLESCTSVRISPSSTSLLLECGADPTILSIADTVQDCLKPIHLVAGNCRGKNGLMKLNYLLGENPCCDARVVENPSVSSIRREMLFGAIGNPNENVLHLSLEKKNFRVALRLWEMQLQCYCEDGVKNKFGEGWDMKYATLLGEAAIDGYSLELFQFAVGAIVLNSPMKKKSTIEKVLAKLLLLAVDERTGFGTHFSGSQQPLDKIDRNIFLAAAVDIILQQQKQLHLSDLSIWAQDNITGHTPLHLLLRTDRGLLLRRSLIQPLCEIMTYAPHETTSLISIPCSDKFGSFTPLHLACALNCSDSIITLIAFGADQTLVDGNDKKPADLLPDKVSIGVILSKYPT